MNTVRKINQSTKSTKSSTANPATETAAKSKGETQAVTNKKAIHVLPETYGRFKKIIDDANQKNLGKRSTHEDAVAALLDLCDGPKVVDELKKRSLRTKDHTQKIYQDYCKLKGNISYDEFIFKALTKQIDINLSVSSTSES